MAVYAISTYVPSGREETLRFTCLLVDHESLVTWITLQLWLWLAKAKEFVGSLEDSLQSWKFLIWPPNYGDGWTLTSLGMLILHTESLRLALLLLTLPILTLRQQWISFSYSYFRSWSREDSAAREERCDPSHEPRSSKVSLTPWAQLPPEIWTSGCSAKELYHLTRRSVAGAQRPYNRETE